MVLFFLHDLVSLLLRQLSAQIIMTHLLWRHIKCNCPQVNNVDSIKARKDKEETGAFSFARRQTTEAENYCSLVLFHDLYFMFTIYRKVILLYRYCLHVNVIDTPTNNNRLTLMETSSENGKKMMMTMSEIRARMFPQAPRPSSVAAATSLSGRFAKRKGEKKRKVGNL